MATEFLIVSAELALIAVAYLVLFGPLLCGGAPEANIVRR